MAANIAADLTVDVVSRSKWRSDAILKTFSAIHQSHVVQLTRNLKGRSRNTPRDRLRDPMANILKHKMTDDHHFENGYMTIFQPRNVRFRWNSMGSCAFLPRDAMRERGLCCRSVSVCPSVRPSVRLSRWCTVPRRLKMSSNFFLGPVAPSF